MIRHIVAVAFAPDTADSERTAIAEQLAALRDVVPGILAFAFGPNVSPEGLGRGYSHAFTFDFQSAAVRDAYLIHPDHQAAGARLVRATQGGVDGLAVIDIEV